MESANYWDITPAEMVVDCEGCFANKVGYKDRFRAPIGDVDAWMAHFAEAPHTNYSDREIEEFLRTEAEAFDVDEDGFVIPEGGH